MATRELLKTIESLVDTQNENFLHIRTLLIDQQVSNYPIFIFQKPSQNVLGKKILDQAQNSEKWNIFITHLEELYIKKIILEEKIDEFKFQYKNNHDKYCILLIENEDEFSFIFVPIIY